MPSLHFNFSTQQRILVQSRQLVVIIDALLAIISNAEGPLSWRITMAENIDLYEGTGDPCAGQDRLKGCTAGFATLELETSTENFGADPPIGSGENYSKKKSSGSWGPLSYI
jgi:hypothetical protein